ncbi:hypothetical protein GCM10010104_25740 [Streptomyces indiaensis]|uniref:Uncharacterized protein n=1 Tax=Streptomyces indiaensis TaxID=284033 RepID=A0ABN3DH61_9ACTN
MPAPEAAARTTMRTVAVDAYVRPHIGAGGEHECVVRADGDLVVVRPLKPEAFGARFAAHLRPQAALLDLGRPR